jgi:thiol-disulfide isomerase/thioredoxin
MLSVFLLTASLLAVPLQEAQVKEPINQAVEKKEEPAKPQLIPAGKAGELPCDSKDHQAVLLGATTREAILSHRDIYRDHTKHRDIKAEWAARWKAITAPCTLVVVFGSWCSDSQMELPDLLALAKEPNPFVTIHYIGVYRDKKADASAWPKGIAPQVIEKVPTIWVFSLQPGGTQKLLGSIVETPPNGQRTAEAVLDLLALAR